MGGMAGKGRVRLTITILLLCLDSTVRGGSLAAARPAAGGTSCRAASATRRLLAAVCTSMGVWARLALQVWARMSCATARPSSSSNTYARGCTRRKPASRPSAASSRSTRVRSRNCTSTSWRSTSRAALARLVPTRGFQYAVTYPGYSEVLTGVGVGTGEIGPEGGNRR